MTIVQLIASTQIYLTWIGLGLIILAIIAFLFSWGIRFRLTGSAIFTLLLSGSCWAFTVSYTPTFKVEGAVYAPIVYDNGNDIVIAQAKEDFPQEAITPTLQQLAGNLKGGGRKGQNVHVRLRKVEVIEEGVDAPIILGEVIRDIKEETTTGPEEINISDELNISEELNIE